MLKALIYQIDQLSTEMLRRVEDNWEVFWVVFFVVVECEFREELGSFRGQLGTFRGCETHRHSIQR